MDPLIISDTIQEFNGTRFYKCGAYFQHTGKALHVEVWTQAHGPIPEGFEIHHRDHNRSNNALSNLELLEGSEHARLHSRTPENRRRALEQLPAARELAKEWHGSEAGREWHKEQYKRTADALHAREERTCEECGTVFMGLIGKPERNRFCSNKCKTRWRYKSGVDNEERNCRVCGKQFMINKYWTTMTCSRSCGRKLQEKNRERQ